MKYKKILLLYGLTLPSCILIRTLQLFFTVDAATGFYKTEYEAIGHAMLIFIAVFCAINTAFCFTGHRNPEKPPRTDHVLTVVSILCATLTGAEIFTESFSGTVLSWQASLLYFTGLAVAAWFILYAVKDLAKINLPTILTAIPAAYIFVRIICDFSSISSLALISDNILFLAAYCLLLLFFLSFGKLYNDLDTERNFRKLMAFGMASSVICLTQAIPHFIVNIYGKSYNHTSLIANASLLTYGVFAALFTLKHFSIHNSED